MYLYIFYDCTNYVYGKLIRHDKIAYKLISAELLFLLQNRDHFYNYLDILFG